MSIFNSLIHTIANLLKLNKWQLITAESCTGGLLSALLTEIPGSSDWFERGFVTYSNLAKTEMLGVPEKLLKEYGAVSTQVAAAMADGALKHSTGQIAVSITGIAGPDGGSVEKPVGTVCFGWVTQHASVISIRKQFGGSREEIRLAACHEALEGILRILSRMQ